ncbi:MAG: extracellular solute-binding protein [Treponema sp.]|nr:extracellular solute-binding protein [Treponema sp.]
MKRFLLAVSFFALLITAVFAGGAGGRAPAQTGPDPAFFNRKPSGTITVSAYDSMLYKSYLEEAAKAFEAMYPGVKVNVETFSAMPEIKNMDQGNMRASTVQMQDDPQAKSDYISRVNTNLMSGTGADVYAMDVLPLRKFVGSGTLENLDPYMKGDPGFNIADYRQNIFDALRYRGGIWFLPMDYTFNYYVYDSTLVPAQIASVFGADKAWSADKLMKLGIPLYSGNYKLFSMVDYFRGPAGMFNQYLRENITSFINLETGKPNFLDGQFSGLLASITDYAQKGYIPRGVTGQQNAGQIMQLNMQAPTDRFFFKSSGNIGLVTMFSRGTGRQTRMITAGVSAGIEDNDEIAGIQANADGTVPFNFNQGFGINSQSKNKETAWAFMKFLLSKEMQLSTNIMNFGLPVNNQAREEKAALTFSGAAMGINMPVNDQIQTAIENYKTAVEKLSDSINTYVVQDTSLNDMIAQEVQYYFSGSRTADEVAKVLQNKADLYLSE